MPPLRDDALALDMLIYARRAREFNDGVTWERFSTDRLLQYATQYALQCIGEDQTPSQDWRNYPC